MYVKSLSVLRVKITRKNRASAFAYQTFWPKQGRGQPVKFLFSSKLITMQNLVAVSHSVFFLGGPKNSKIWGTLAPPLGMGPDYPVEIPPPHVCHLAKCGRSGSNGTSVSTEVHRKNLTPCVAPFRVIRGHRNRHGSIG